MVLPSEHNFGSPREQLEWVKKRIQEHKEVVPYSPEEAERVHYESVKKALGEMESMPEESEGAYKLSHEEIGEKSHVLSREPHHNQVDELMNIMKEKGLISALKVVRGVGNPHLVDDFHDRLIAEELSHDSTITPPVN